MFAVVIEKSVEKECWIPFKQEQFEAEASYLPSLFTYASASGEKSGGFSPSSHFFSEKNSRFIDLVKQTILEMTM